MNQWIVVPVLLPAMTAGLLLLAGPRLPRWFQRAIGIFASVALLAVAVHLVRDANAGAVQVYALGDWRPPFGIALVLDRLSALMLLLTAGLGFCALIGASGGVDAESPYFHALFQFQLMGLNGAFLTGDLFNLFVFFEVLLIASYCLLLAGNTPRRLHAGMHYVVVNLVGSSLFLIAAGLLYALTGTLNLADLAVKLPQLGAAEQVLAHSAALMLLVVFALKAALFPLFLWMPPAYSAASAPVAALFAIMTKVGVYSILRVCLVVFEPAAGIPGAPLSILLVPAGLTTMLCGAVGALASRRLSGVTAQLTLLSAGTILAVAGLATQQALSAALFYLAHSTLAMAMLFLLCGPIAAGRGEASDQLRQMGSRQSVVLSLLFGLAVIVTVGIPPMSGFLAKLMLLQASEQASQWPAIWSVILASSLLALLSLMRAGITLFWAVRNASAAAPLTRQVPQVAAPVLLALAITALSVGAEPVKHFMNATAVQMTDVSAYTRAVLSTPGRP
jgi:multicomponent K+:H+ antiporter subunit D